MERKNRKICEAVETRYGFEVRFLGHVKQYGFTSVRSTKGKSGDIYVDETGMIITVDTPTTIMLLPSTGCMMAIEEIKDPLQDSPVIMALRDRYDGGDKCLTTLKELPAYGYSIVPGANPGSNGKLASKLLGKTLQEIEKRKWFKLKPIGS